MKKAINIFWVLIASISLFAQDRNNDPEFSFDKKSSPLTEAIGWIKSDGKWIDNKNEISSEKQSKITSFHTLSNFTSLTMARINVDSKKYYVLYWMTYYGDYEFPTLRQGNWIEFHRPRIVILDEEKYYQFKSSVLSKSGIENDIESLPDILVSIAKDSSENLLIRDARRIIKEYPEYYNSGMSMSMVINSQTTKDGDVVRFKFPDVIMSHGHNLINSYFEAKLEDFKKLLID